eukprot:TRINITY_DN20940_c0_g1_i2.p1 TRINITY_DN20940_c0_g1~~TRINITY_DN20940_c0_g1_i2.p1  ORF type:complete len:155 (+),score=29.46 TRINITY_DN20940_c0_g1_i2:128-592(+)
MSLPTTMSPYLAWPDMPAAGMPLGRKSVALPFRGAGARDPIGSQRFPDMTWTARADVVDPPGPPAPKQLSQLIATYSGHDPKSWSPSLRKQQLGHSTSQPSFRVTKDLPRAARTASDDVGMWYAFMGRFPNTVDGWSPDRRTMATFVDRRDRRH